MEFLFSGIFNFLKIVIFSGWKSNDSFMESRIFITLRWFRCTDIASLAQAGKSGKLIWEATMVRYSLKISAIYRLSTLVLSGFVFNLRKTRDSAQERSALLLEVCHRLFSQGKYLILLTSIFVPELGSKLAKFVSSHITTMNSLLWFWIHVRGWLAFYQFEINRCIGIYVIAGEGACVPSHVIRNVKNFPWHEMGLTASHIENWRRWSVYIFGISWFVASVTVQTAW